jgi:predicted CXXCH cytochrome family protein
MIKNRAYLYLFIITAILAIAAHTSALEMSSKRDCAVCHIMWLDDFRTDKETLIKWQPGNVLMKDTQGVVSAEDNCYSCHDGYVVDSRYIVNKHKQHKIFVKPSKKVTIPSTLPLSNKDEIYCGTCHTAHGPGAPPAGDLPAPASFFRVRNIDSNLCEMCHTDQTEFKRTNSHPLKNTTLQLPDILFESGSKKARDRNKIICQTCHKAHGAKGDKITIVDNKNSELCITCHDKQKSLIDTRHDLRVSLPQEKNIKQQLSSQSGPCSACHTPHNAAGKKLWAKQLAPGIAASRMCLTCHGKDSGYENKRIGRHSHPVNIDSSSKKSVTGDLPLFSADGTENPAGRVQCFTCHDVHRWDPGAAADKGKKGFEGDASNSFLRMANDASSTLCLTCHNDKKEVITTDHNLKITAPNAKNLKQFSAHESGPCGACHIPHNAAGQRLWARRLKPGDFASQACIGCHDQNVGFPSKLIGKHSHPLGVDLPSKISITDKLPLFSANGTKNPAGKIQCFTCHDAHRWDPKAPSDNKGKNLEGDGSNSFLRIAGSQSSTLCLTCHNDKKQIITSDHNLQVTAPEEKNLQGSPAGISGPCGACHIPHNAAGQRLWAKRLAGDKDFSTQLCTGCHDPSGAAKAKLIGPNDHPVNVTFFRSKMQKSGDPAISELPLYGKDGKRAPKAQVACMTCHEPHTWEPNKSGPLLNSEYKNLEGNATNSFLRKANFPSSNLCKTCHIDKALVEGTDHDLSVTAPKATNLLGQTVKESGQCGTCHLVHNSPNKLKLWARSYGPVSDQVSMMNALCRSCHSKGQLAEAKIPGITVHPEGKLVNNILLLAREEPIWAPIYNKTGRETNIGYISCPTCHNGHQWSPFIKQKGLNKNLEGDAKTSFLRNLSSNILCRDCHGLDALYKYKYFHNPLIRGGSKIQKKLSAPKYFNQ